jgi:hypothetical protein
MSGGLLHSFKSLQIINPSSRCGLSLALGQLQRQGALAQPGTVATFNSPASAAVLPLRWAGRIVRARITLSDA